MGGLLVVMGSGETAPTMVKPHRAIFERVGDAPAVLLDTPYGFQENADDITSKAIAYFDASVGRAVSALSWRVTPPAGLARDRALARLDEAGWVFAGPGSPTYALKQWIDTPVPEALAGVLERGGVVVFASAAALTLGSHAVPVYEIYKAGVDPAWVPGLDLVRRATGLPAVLIPHYDNAEGGHHDTRFSYLGERRLSMMERDLPEDAVILGVDEHTGAEFDLDARTVTVTGRGGFTVRRHGNSAVYPTGSVVSFDTLAGIEPSAAAAPPAPPVVEEAAGSTGSLRADADRLEEVFAAAYAARDVEGCVAALLDLEQVLVDWSADTLTSDEGDHARTVLRRMVLRLGELAVAGAADPRTVVGPFVDALLELRERARAARDFATSDWVRDCLVGSGVEVRDTPTGVAWELRAPASR
jgi:cyanophycinase-like exopeptidase